MSLDLKALDKKVTDVLDQMTDKDWKNYKTMVMRNRFNTAKRITKVSPIIYYEHDDFSWELDDIFNVLEEIQDTTIRVNDGKLRDYLIKNEIIKKYMRHDIAGDNFESFYTVIYNLKFPKFKKDDTKES